MEHLAKIGVKLVMVLVAFSLAGQALGGMINFLPKVAPVLLVACLLMGVGSGIKHHSTEQGFAKGFYEGAMWMPARIWSLMLTITGFVFRFFSSLIH